MKAYLQWPINIDQILTVNGNDDNQPVFSNRATDLIEMKASIDIDIIIIIVENCKRDSISISIDIEVLMTMIVVILTGCNVDIDGIRDIQLTWPGKRSDLKCYWYYSVFQYC